MTNWAPSISPNGTSKECRLCHRIGSRGFAPSGSEEWACTNDLACATRAAEREASMAPAAGFFISFEGGEGAGKTTQIELLARRLERRGLEVLTTREPGATALGRAIRDMLLHGDHIDPRVEALLFAADRAHHVTTIVRPALDRRAVVITDRYLDSSVVYQGHAGRLDPAWVESLSTSGTDGLLPDLTILLDADPDSPAIRARLTGRGGGPDRIESAGDTFHRAVREGFLARARVNPDRFVVLDATAGTERDIHWRVLDAVSARLTRAAA